MKIQALTLALMIVSSAGGGTSAQLPSSRPESRVEIKTIPGGMALVRDVTGDYRQHPSVFAELMRIRDARYVPQGDVFGVYPTDPDSLETTDQLKWQVGVLVAGKGGGRPAAPSAPYRLREVAPIEAAVLETTVQSAAIDGLSMLRWLPEHGYVQSGPTRMEYTAFAGNPMLTPARIIVPIKKRRSGLILPPARDGAGKTFGDRQRY